MAKQSTKKATKKRAAKKARAATTKARKSAVKKSAAKKSVAKKPMAKKAGVKMANRTVAATAASRRSSSPELAKQIAVKQETEYMGRNWWKWSVWIEAPSTVLKNIESVVYKLHSTFDAERIQRRTDHKTNFRLESSGWGEFTINLEIKPKNGSAFTKRHWLALEYPQPTQSLRSNAAVAIPSEKRPTVFLSAGITDLRMGNSLARALREEGIVVLKTDELTPDVPWDFAVSEMIKNADVMVVLLSGRPTGWTIREIYAAKNQKTKLPIVPIVIGSETVLPDELQGFQAINLKDANEPDAIATNVATQVINRIKVLPRRS